MKSQTTSSWSIRVPLFAFLLFWTGSPANAQEEVERPAPTLGVEEGIDTLQAGSFELRLVRASQTAAGLAPTGDLQTVAGLAPAGDSFDFTPADWLERRSSDGFYHLGDMNLRYRVADSGGEWVDVSTAAGRGRVRPLPVDGALPARPTDPANPSDYALLAAADLTPTLPADLPLQITRSWISEGEDLVLRFDVTNQGSAVVELGALGFPMVFNNILHRRTLDEAHRVASFHDPYIGLDAGYVQVTRLNGEGPVLLVVPEHGTPFEAWRPLLDDPTPRGITFEGFHEWMVHSEAWAQNEWSNAQGWNEPSSTRIEPGQGRSYGLRFMLAPSIREIENTLVEAGRPVVTSIPGTVLPMDQPADLFIEATTDVASIDIQPKDALDAQPVAEGYYLIRGLTWGRARLTLTYKDGRRQSIHYKVTNPMTQIVDDLGRFLFDEQWFEGDSDPFGRAPGVISYDYANGRQVREDNRAWIAGLGDEGGSGSWLAAFMKQLIRPNRYEVEKLEQFIDQTLWGGLQYDEGEFKYGVRKSLFYFEPDSMPAGTYSDSIGYGGWSSWSREHAETVGRSYNYPHVAAAYWVMYRLARNHVGLVANRPWQWYLEQAHETAQAMARLAPEYAQFGQMEGTIFLLILKDMQLEGWTRQAEALEETMLARAQVWRELPYPYGSEMPWDSTGQEEVYAWCRYFGFDEKAAITLNAILGYMPTIAHWGYNGSARRYWDFMYAGHPATSRLERQLHHYGSGLNAIPVLTEYRDHPDDLYLLRVGYGGLMGSIANITQEGFGPSGFHSYPQTLKIDGYSGDYGPGFFGHAVNTATYVVQDSERGWQAFGGLVRIGSDDVLPGDDASDPKADSSDALDSPGLTESALVGIQPLDAARSRVFLAPFSLWLTLDAGTFERISFDPEGTRIRIILSPEDPYTHVARLRVETTTDLGALYEPESSFPLERGAYVVDLAEEQSRVVLLKKSSEAIRVN